MRRTGSACFAAVAMAVVLAGGARAGAGPAPTPAASPGATRAEPETAPPYVPTLADEAGVRIAGQDLVAAWNRADAAALAALFASDAHVIEPHGRIAIGSKEIESLMRELLAGAMEGKAMRMHRHSVRFLTQDVAVSDIDVELARPGPPGKPAESLPMHLTQVLVRAGPRWPIAVWRPAIHPPPPGDAAAEPGR